jgi:hypothetical protein
MISSEVSQKTGRPSMKVEPQARLAIGQWSPQAIALQVGLRWQVAMEEHPKELNLLVKKYWARKDPEDIAAGLAGFDRNPELLVNELHYINPKLSLRNIQKMDPLKLAEAVMRMYRVSDRTACPLGQAAKWARKKNKTPARMLSITQA